MISIRVTHNAVVGFQRAMCPEESLRGAHRRLREACSLAVYIDRAPGWLRPADPSTDGYLVLHNQSAALPVRRGRAVACLINQTMQSHAQRGAIGHQEGLL
jgi:hypothetical protein